MGFKNISISDEVYDLLKKRKNHDESFSEEIFRLLGQCKVSDLGRIITDEEAREWEKGVKKVRESAKVRPWSS